ncbi:hypothetical protein O9X90_00280 [Agrobacterium leguminum]|uniref:hypothetical protein n=1 Tax=Agrobacterium leguminum TaxID=2792015 RepID=UPI0022B8307D|nr:hypothetical protein [Agrobacterium leguminum]MCZ7930737.1 hypothetical protein [Agrobacterium leguminum]
MVRWAGAGQKEISRKGVSMSILVPPILGRVPAVFFHRGRFDIGGANRGPLAIRSIVFMLLILESYDFYIVVITICIFLYLRELLHVSDAANI